MSAPREITLQEWSRLTPRDCPALAGRYLDAADRVQVAELSRHSSLRVTELREGLAVEVGPHVGAVTVAGLRIGIRPKLPLHSLMGMVAYALDLRDLRLSRRPTGYAPGEGGPADLLGLALLESVQGLMRGGLLPCYREREETLDMPRGRILMRPPVHAHSHPRCRYADFSLDHELNRLLRAGMALAARLVGDPALGLALRRVLRDLSPVAATALTGRALNQALQGLDRRSAYYRPALTLVTLLHQGACLSDPVRSGGVTLPGFLLDMNRLFEAFVTRWLQTRCPAGTQVLAQQRLTHPPFYWLENPAGWRAPLLRPDLLFVRDNRVVAVADAKYRDHRHRPPDTAELYQLTTYGLACPLPEPRRVLLLYPLPGEEAAPVGRLRFDPAPGSGAVMVDLVGVPVARLLAGKAWWPLDGVEAD